MLYKFKCGCIGFKTGHPVKQLIVNACEDKEFCLSFRDIHEDGELLGEMATGTVVGKLRNLITDGYKYREIKNLLK